MTVSSPHSARPHRGSRRRATPRRLAATLAAIVVMLGGAPAAAWGVTSEATTPAVAATSSDASYSVAPAARGIVTAGQPVTVTVAAQTPSGTSSNATNVLLTTSTRPLATRAEVSSWLNDESPDASRAEMPLATGTLPASGLQTSRSVDIVIDPATVAALGPGVYPLRAEFATSPDNVAIASVLVVPNGAGSGPLSVVVPITAPAITTGLLTATQLSELTASGGALRAQLDAVRGTPAVLAIDPAIAAAIGVLGNSAPATAVQWLDELRALPNTRFALQFADADLAAQFAAGVTTPLTLDTLTPWMSPDNFTVGSATPAPTGEQGELGTPAATPSPDPTASPGAPTLPSVAQLTNIGASTIPAFWPASGTASSILVGTLGASRTENDETPLTLVDSSTLIDDSPAGAWATSGGAPVLVYDADISRALGIAAGTDDTTARAAALAQASAFAAVATTTSPDAGLLVTVDRTASHSAAAARDTLVAAMNLAGRTASDLSALTAAAPVSVMLGDGTAADAVSARGAELATLLDDERALTGFSSILSDPTVLTAPERASLLHLLANEWALQPTERADALSAHRSKTAETLASVAIVPPSDITLAANSAPLTFTVRNDLRWPVTLSFVATQNDPRLIVQNITPVKAGASQNTRVQVPVEARVGSGESTLDLQLRSPSNVAIGGEVPVHVAVRAEWESVGAILMVAVVALLIVLGAIRTVRKFRTSAPQKAAQPGDEAQPDPQTNKAE